MKVLLSLAAVGAMTLSSAPAVAQHHGSHDRARHHAHHSHHARWSTGYRFGPSYSYTSYRSIPRTYVTRYRLSPRYRYVYTNGYIYQVDPRTYAITRIINALTGY
jgi:hypothetical protein